MRDWAIAAFVVLFAATFAAALAAWAAQDAGSGPAAITSQAVDPDEGLTLAAVEVNLTEGWTVSEGQRVLVADDRYVIHELPQRLEVPNYVRTGDADAALEIAHPDGGGQLVVAYEDRIEIELPGPRNGTAASMNVHLSSSATSVEMVNDACNVQVTEGQSQQRSHVFVLDRAGDSLTGHLSGPGEACPTGQLTVRHLGSGWTWSPAPG